MNEFDEKTGLEKPQRKLFSWTEEDEDKWTRRIENTDAWFLLATIGIALYAFYAFFSTYVEYMPR